MSMTKKEILAAAMALEPDDRQDVAEELWCSLDSAAQERVTEAWVQEIERRLDLAARGEGNSKPVDEVVARLRTKARQ